MDFKSGLKPTQKHKQQQQEQQQQPSLGLLPTIGLLILTAIAISAVYKARRDPWTIAFVVPAYINLMLFFWCFRTFDMLPPEAPTEKKEILKLEIWVLATTLNLLFACRSSEIMPGVVAVTFWVMAAFTGVTGFLVLFIYRHANTNSYVQGKNCNNKASEEDII